MLTLACGPYFDENGLLISLVLFLALKPLTYFAFIQAFRYRVSRPIPMRFRQALWLTVYRAGLGLAFAGAGAATIALTGRDELILASWGYLYAARLFSWWLVGSTGAGLRGRRLVGWIISGTLINAAFDVAMIGGFIGGWMPSVIIVSIVGAFIAALHVIGRRDALKARFETWSHCRACDYDLTGNLSGICPECGVRIGTRLAPARAAAG